MEKKLKALEQREAKLKVEKLDLERNQRKPELNNCIKPNKFWIVPSSASNESSISSSMVSHWIPPSYEKFESFESTSSMVAHTAMLSFPVKELLSIEDVLEAMDKAFKEAFRRHFGD